MSEKRIKVHLLDYGAGNVKSVKNAIERAGYEVEEIKSSKDLTTPGLVCLSFALICRIFVISLSVSIRTFFEPYDTTATLPPFDRVPQSLQGLFSWDAQHFLRISRSSRDFKTSVFSRENGTGGYKEFEQLHAFFPLYPVLISLVADVFVGPLSYVFVDRESMLAFSAILINNLSTIVAACLLYFLGRRVLLYDGPQIDGYKDRVAFIASLLFCISPCGIFFSAAYSEGLYAALSFAGMLCAEYAASEISISISILKLVIASFFFIMAAAVRSNGILLSGYLLYVSFQVVSMRKTLSKIWVLVFFCITFFLCIMVAFPYITFQYYGYSLFCSKDTLLDSLNPSNLTISMLHPPQWCNKLFPSIYSHVQSTYWNIGLMKYWQTKHIGMFVLAMPILGLSVDAVIHHPFNFNQLITLVLSSLSLQPNRNLIKNIDKELPYVLHLVFLSFFAIFFMHIQVSTRLLASSCPLLYWHAARIFLNASINSWKRIILLFFFCGYSIIGTILFSLHFNWT
jgi:GPI mannosyltransferase 2